VQSLLLSSSGIINDLFSRGSSQDKAFAFILEFGTFSDLLETKARCPKRGSESKEIWLSIHFFLMK
jgi:hypothetical protein